MVKPSSNCSDEFEAQFVKPKAGRTLIVGSYITKGKSDRRALYSDVVGVDMRDGPGVDRVLNLEWFLPYDLGTFAHVECRSVLEHSRRPWLLAANVEMSMEPGATLYLSVPFVWGLHDYGGDFFRFTADAVRELFPRIEWQTLMYASDRLETDPKKTARTLIEGHVYVARNEVVGFGVKR